MTARHDDPWRLATWEGSRREQLRRALLLTLRERLQALDDMAELARRFERMREAGRLRRGSLEHGE